jgi:hypothetical protein
MAVKNAATDNLVKFAGRTHDTAWIKRNNGTTDSDGRTTILVPAGKVERFQMRGNDWLRHTLTDCPRDFARVALCPAYWVD